MSLSDGLNPRPGAVRLWRPGLHVELLCSGSSLMHSIVLEKRMLSIYFLLLFYVQPPGLLVFFLMLSTSHQFLLLLLFCFYSPYWEALKLRTSWSLIFYIHTHIRVYIYILKKLFPQIFYWCSSSPLLLPPEFWLRSENEHVSFEVGHILMIESNRVWV